MTWLLWGSPPHTRGIHQTDGPADYSTGITPAHAGNTQVGRLPVGTVWDHPRTRGEYYFLHILFHERQGSPPHTRGIHNHCEVFLLLVGITPAHAGNTRPCPLCLCSVRDHPRTRGEYPPLLPLTIAMKGSPPHTRGILETAYQCFAVHGITPAHAGNTSYRLICKRYIRDHPRTRGEYL